MDRSPFKFLDSYTKEDRDIFFGRDKEIEELYTKVFESKILLVYGVSGTGKSSLIHCGLANKFEDSDWLPINIRRGNNINESLAKTISKHAITQFKSTDRGDQLAKAIKSLYLDHFKPIYLIFDQFEELFIFGSKDEREQFINEVANIIHSDLNCRIIFVLRGEYLEHITEFEEVIPTFFQNRMRIEKMTRHNAADCITGPCKAHGIEVEEGFPLKLLEKLSPEKAEIELTYLQVFLDKLYKRSVQENPEKPVFTNQMLDELGRIGDVLSDFLEGQIAQLEDSETGLSILKAFVSLEGTKKQISIENIAEFTQTLGKDIPQKTIENNVHQFVDLRILRDKDENDKYELRHDSLAANIYEKITIVEKELLEVRQFIHNSFNEYKKRGVLLNENDLKYMAPYETRLVLNIELKKYVETCKQILNRKQKRKKIFFSFSAILSIVIIFLIYNYWNKQQQEKAILLTKITNSLTVSADKMNVLYIGTDNPISISATGITFDKLHPTISQGSLTKVSDGRYIARVIKSGKAIIEVKAEIEQDTMVYMGKMVFRVKRISDPKAFFLRHTGSASLSMAELITGQKIEIKIENFDFDLKFVVTSFDMTMSIDGKLVTISSKNNRITPKMKEYLSKAKRGSKIYFEKIRAAGPDGTTRKLGGISLKVI